MNAADEISPGTEMSFASIGVLPKIEMIFLFFDFLTLILAPKYLSMISVWSRVSKRSSNVEIPFVFNAAKHQADFNWALGTFNFWSFCNPT